MKICLIYASDNPYGGWMTYTRHLHDSLEATGKHDVTIVKFRPQASHKERPLGYGLFYEAVTPESIAAGGFDAVLVVAVQKNFGEQVRDVLERVPNSGMVIHDGNECKHVNTSALSGRVVVIRPGNLRLAPKAIYIPHPYVANPGCVVASAKAPARRKSAVSVSRIDHDKNTTILLDANRILPENRRIDIRGFENRIYTRFTVMPKYPEWKQSQAAFPREKDAALEILGGYKFMVDMSTIKGDGGGSQYTFLEAIEAGCCCVLNTEWTMKATGDEGDFIPGVNCLAAGTPEELVKVLSRTTEATRAELVRRSTEILAQHASPAIQDQYAKFFKKLARMASK